MMQEDDLGLAGVYYRLDDRLAVHMQIDVIFEHHAALNTLGDDALINSDMAHSAANLAKTQFMTTHFFGQIQIHLGQLGIAQRLSVGCIYKLEIYAQMRHLLDNHRPSLNAASQTDDKNRNHDVQVSFLNSWENQMKTRLSVYR